MRKTLIALLCAGAAASQAFAQSACVAADGSPIKLESAEAIVGKLGNLTKIEKGTFETEDEFQERVSQIALSLNLDRHIVIGPVDVHSVKYDFDREMLLIRSSFIEHEAGGLEGFNVGVSSKDLGSYEAQNSYGAQATVTRRELHAYRIRGADESKKYGKDGARWLDLDEVIEPKWEGGPMGPVQYVGIPMDRNRARELENKLNIAFVYKPSEPFYSRVNWNNTDPTLASPYRTAYYTNSLYGDVSCALVVDDKGKKLATVLMSGTPLSAEAERKAAEAEAAARYKAAIASLQTALIARGYEPGNADGEMSETTVLALESLSSDSGYSLAAVDLKSMDAPSIEALSLAVLESPVYYPKLGQTFTDCTDCPSMVVLPAGSFVMGSPETEQGRDKDEGPQRTVSIGSPLAVGRFEVTSAEWDVCKADGACDEVKVSYPFYNQQSNAPIVNVNWGDAQAYVSWLSRKTGQQYRLLTEAEWEYAARAGTTTPFSFGATITPSQANYGGEHTYTRNITYTGAVQVGSFSPNAWGLYDMHGNVSEWTQDCWNKNYRRAPADGSAWLTGDCSKRVLRGGYWDSTSEGIRSASRSWTDNGRYTSVGFRVARTLTTK